MKAAIFTLDSDLYKDKKESKTAIGVKRLLEQVGFEVKATGVLPKDKEVAFAVLNRLTDSGSVDLILTIGGVGIHEDDCAPDVVARTSQRMLPGIPEAIRAYSIRYSRRGVLDRSVAGIKNHTIMVNLSEDAREAKESLEYILPELIHVVESLSI